MESRGTYGSGAGERGHVGGGELSRNGRIGGAARGHPALGAARGGVGRRGGGGRRRRMDRAQRGAAERRHRERLANWREDSEKSEIWEGIGEELSGVEGGKGREEKGAAGWSAPRGFGLRAGTAA
jgi:hypothetical protein